ncbi:MAG: terminase [Blastocatellia bacterium]|nr:terminase [Blastocatellia bacterium]
MSDAITDSQKELFLEHLRKSGNVSASAKKAKISRRTAYYYRESNEEFRASWDDAIEEAGDWLESEARRRAEKGVLKPVYQGGKLVGKIRVYSDSLLTLLLKGAKPDKYRDRHEFSGPGGGAIPVSIADALDRGYGDKREDD